MNTTLSVNCFFASVYKPTAVCCLAYSLYCTWYETRQLYSRFSRTRLNHLISRFRIRARLLAARSLFLMNHIHCSSYKSQLCHLPLNDGMMEAIDGPRGSLIRRLADCGEYIRSAARHTPRSIPAVDISAPLRSGLRGREDRSGNMCRAELEV